MNAVSFSCSFSNVCGEEGPADTAERWAGGEAKGPSKGGPGARRDLCGLPALGLSPPFSLVTALLVSSLTLPLSLLPTLSPFKIN